MKITKITLFLLLAAGFAGLLSACGGSKETTLSGPEQDAVLAYTEAKTDNLMAGMKAGDYAAFSQDFDPDMLKAMPQEAFGPFKQGYDGKLGGYVSRQVNKVTQSESGKHVAVIYDAVFEKGNITMRVVFQTDDPHQISGLWFK